MKAGGVGWKGAPKLCCGFESLSVEVKALKGDSPNGSSNVCIMGDDLVSNNQNVTKKKKASASTTA